VFRAAVFADPPREAHLFTAFRAANRAADLGFDFVDAGHGWLIFAVPPSEIAVHPLEGSELHELYLMCDDLADEIRTLEQKGVACTAAPEARWVSLAKIKLPGGGKVGLYQPQYPSPIVKIP
jgi:hypothetical protein